MTDKKEKIPPHWHVASGLQGYGPDGSNGTFDGYEGLDKLLEGLRDDLEGSMDAIHEQMSIAYEATDPQGLFEEFGRLRRVELAHISMGNLLIQWGRVEDTAPEEGLRGDWADRVFASLGVFPLPVSHNTSLYAWRCEAGQDCEHREAEQ